MVVDVTARLKPMGSRAHCTKTSSDVPLDAHVPTPDGGPCAEQLTASQPASHGPHIGCTDAVASLRLIPAPDGV